MKISLGKYTSNVIMESPEIIHHDSVIPASNHLLQVHKNKERRLLNSELVDVFHRTVTQLLFLIWKLDKKYRLQLHSLQLGSKTLMKINGTNCVASYIIYAGILCCLWPLRWQTWAWSSGGQMQHPWCIPTSTAISWVQWPWTRAQLLMSPSNRRFIQERTPESEIARVDDIQPKVSWVNHFINAQWYNQWPVLYQNKQAPFKLKLNGKSSSQQTQHLNICYFFIKDQVNQG